MKDKIQTAERAYKMSKSKIFVSSRLFGRLSPEAIAILEKVGTVTRSPLMGPLTEEELIDQGRDSNAIIVGFDPVTVRVLEALDKLKVVGNYGVGYDNIDVTSATKRGVAVTYTPHANATSVAEYVFALILSLVRTIIPADSSIRSGRWGGPEFLGVELEGKTLGIIGLGAIGSRVARIAKGFGMKLLCHTGHPEKHLEEAERYGVEFTDLETLLRESDIVTLHVTLTPQTRHLIGEGELKLMKSSAILVNTSRGGVVDGKALTRALENGWIAGAGLDVFEQEPPQVDNPLLHMKNLVATPHIGAFTRDAIKRMDAAIANDVAAVLKGTKPTYILNPEVLQSDARKRSSG